MEIGDRVRLLHGNEEGIITKISPGGRVEIEIEDGFRIPALKNEIVIISANEGQYFGRGKESETKPVPPRNPTQLKTEGIFLAYVPLNDKNHSLYLVNNTGKDYLCATSEIVGENSRTIFAGTVSAYSSKKLEEKSIANFEEWPMLYFQFLPVNRQIEKAQLPFEKKIKFKAGNFFKSKGKTPLLEKEGFVFKIDIQTQDLDINLLNRELSQDKPETDYKSQVKRPQKEIDLHIQHLSNDIETMGNQEKLLLQLEVFEKNLNAAITTGLDEITFIHGIGNGILKKEIHRRLSQLTNIKYFQDTQKNNFGYGATLVRIK